MIGGKAGLRLLMADTLMVHHSIPQRAAEIKRATEINAKSSVAFLVKM
jgi:hypothetical protein